MHSKLYIAMIAGAIVFGPSLARAADVTTDFCGRVTAVSPPALAAILAPGAFFQGELTIDDANTSANIDSGPNPSVWTPGAPGPATVGSLVTTTAVMVPGDITMVTEDTGSYDIEADVPSFDLGGGVMASGTLSATLAGLGNSQADALADFIDNSVTGTAAVALTVDGIGAATVDADVFGLGNDCNRGVPATPVWGLIAIAVLLGGTAFYMIRSRRAT